MVNQIRRLLLALALGILAVAGFHIFSSKEQPAETTAVKVLDSGFDVEIENFKVVHEVAGEKNWELKADLAQISEKEDLTLLRRVELKMNRGENQEYSVVADSGSIKNESREINLEGNVKMVGDSALVEERLQKKDSQPEKPEN